MSTDTSAISVPTDWREARPARAPALIDELSRAAAAERLHAQAQWPRIGRYQVGGTLGAGGMSTVWEAHDHELGRRVAIKLLRHELSERHGARLRREAQALAKLSHPNVVQVYEVMDVDGLTAVVMELIQGPTLRRWQEQSPPPGWRDCVGVYVQAGRGLAAAHAVGLVHRDFKPDNCILDAQGRVRVLDFGLVAREHDDETPEDLEAPSPDDSLALHLTRTGTLMGTAAYMPPERLGRRGSGDGAAGDQFSFCTSLYEAIHGERPFFGDSEQELTMAVEQGRIRPPRKGSRAPRRLREILARGLAARPRERWPSMTALLEELERVAAPSRRRRRLAVAMVSTGLAAVASSAVMLGHTRGQACTAAESQLRGVWDDTRRRAVRVAILGTGTQHAIETWARVEPMLDDYARRWQDRYTAVCEATRVTRAQTEADMGLRMRCLSGRRSDLREAVEVLMRPGESTRQRSVELVANLPTLAACDDLEALHTELPPPGDRELAAAVERARMRLARVRAQREAGLYASSEADVDGVVEQAQRLGYEPLLAEARLERGELGLALSRWAQAEEDLEGAYDVAQRIEHRRVETRAAALLAHLLAAEFPRAEAAERWARSAMNLAERRGGDRRLLAEAMLAMGHVRMMRGWHDYDDAAKQHANELHRRALALYEHTMGSRHAAVAAALESLGDLQRMRFQPEEALESYERALELYEQSLGPSHPSVAEVLSKLGVLLVGRGELEMALGLYERALRIQQSVFGLRHPSVGLTWTRIGTVRHLQGRYEEAMALHEHALDLVQLAPGQYPHDIGILSEIGFVLRDMGRMEDAVEYYERTVALRQERHGRAHSSIPMVLIAIGDELAERGMLDEAEQRYHRAADLGLANSIPDGYWLGIASLRLGEVALARLDFARAAEHEQRAASTAALEGTKGSPRLDLARARFVLARALARLEHERRLDLAHVHEALAEAEQWAAAAIASNQLQRAPKRE